VPFIQIYGPALLVTLGLMTLLWLASLPLRNSSILWRNRGKAEQACDQKISLNERVPYEGSESNHLVRPARHDWHSRLWFHGWGFLC